MFPRLLAASCNLAVDMVSNSSVSVAVVTHKYTFKTLIISPLMLLLFSVGLMLREACSPQTFHEIMFWRRSHQYQEL